MKKKLHYNQLLITFLIIWSFSISNLHGQTLNFSASRDTINENENVYFNNLSTGFNQSDQFKWEFSSCMFISTAQSVYGNYTTELNDTLYGIIINPLSNTITITITAYDSTGNQIGINPLSKTFVIIPIPISTVWPSDSCHQQIDTCENLICNGSFNWLSDTIINAGQVDNAQPWNQTSSADLFSYNSPPTLGVPSNYFGFQPDHSNQNGLGNYAGFISYWTASIYWREYITQELQSTLIENQRYALDLYLNLGDTSALATNGVQVLFTDTSIANQLNAYIISPTTNNMLDFLGNNTLQDTANWVNFNMVYIPNQPNQKYISIGNFKPDSLLIIDTICSTCYNGSGKWAYYYVDDISLTPLPPELNLTNQSICNPGDTIIIYANAIGDSTLLWSTGSMVDSIIVAPLVDTFYTISATDYTQCHNVIDTVWVFVAPSNVKPNVWLDDAYGCGDIDTLQLSVQGTGAISYLWNTGDTTSSINVVTNGQTQNFSVLVSGQYPPCTDTTLYATVYSSLAVSAPVVTGNINTCDTILTYHIHNYNPLFQYSWSYDNVSFQAINDSIITINCNLYPQLFTGVTLTFKVHDTICNQMASSYFPLLSCCIYPDIQLFLNHKDTLDVNHPFYNSSNHRIEFNNLRMSINDTLYIDANTRFYACDIDMGPYATIYFRNGDSLIFDKTNIRPCDTILWNSVVIPKSNQYLSVKYGIFADAMEVFRIENGAVSYFEGNTFKRNYISVYIKNYNPQVPNPFPIGGYTMPNTYNGTYINNNIIGTSNYLLYPKNTQKSRSGIEMMNMYGFTIGDQSNANQVNTFKNLEYGIYGIHSEFEVYHSNFDSINPYSQSAGIWAGGTFCTSGAMVSFNPLSATIPTNPPLSYASALTASIVAYYNTVNNSSLGIYGGSSRMDTRYNTINAKHNGIVAHEPYYNSHIRNNTISVETYLPSNLQTEYTGIGILVNNVLKKISGINVSDNTINDPAKTGIWLENLSSTSWQISNGWRTVVGNNIVNFTTQIGSNNNWKHYGLRISNCDRAIVGFNQIQNQNSMIPYYWEKQKAISIRDCKDARVYSNYPITNMGTGIHVVGNNINTQFYCNSITNSYNGFYFEHGSGVATYISDQGDSTWATDNTWNDGAQSYKRMAGKINIDTILNIPNYWYFRGNGGSDMQLFNPQIPLNSLFNNKLYGMPGNTSPSICPQPSPNPSDPTEAISYEELRDHYFGEIVRDEIDFEVLAEEFGYFNDEYFYEEMEDYSDWLSLGTMDDTIYQNYYNYLLNSNLGEFDSVITLMEEGGIDEAINRNNGIIPGNAIEVNQKFVDYVYLNYYLKDSLPTASELQTLEYIALLTPWVGGEAVYSARILLGIDPDRHGIAYRLQKDKDNNEQNKITIYPNPTQDAIKIEFVNMPITQISISVFDIIGKKVFEENMIATKKANLNLNSLESGTYLIRISDVNGLIETKLLIIY
jgi:hypothetical protein